VLIEYGTHLVDMAVTLLGMPSRTYARLHRINPRTKGETLALAVFEYPEATAVIDIGWKPDGIAHGGFALEGDRGAVLYEGTLARGASSRFRVTQGETVVVDETRSPYDDYVESFYLLERECADCMLDGGEPFQSGARNFRTLAATFAAYEAAGAWGGAERWTRSSGRVNSPPASAPRWAVRRPSRGVGEAEPRRAGAPAGAAQPATVTARSSSC
jgi:predicted dehydrogenase